MKRKVKESDVAQSSPTLCNPMDCSLLGSSSMGVSRQEYWSRLPFPFPGDLPDTGIEPGLPHCWQTLYCLSHQGTDRKEKSSAFDGSLEIYTKEDIKESTRIHELFLNRNRTLRKSSLCKKQIDREEQWLIADNLI